MPDGMRIRKKEKGEGGEGREEKSKLKENGNFVYFDKLQNVFVQIAKSICPNIHIFNIFRGAKL